MGIKKELCEKICAMFKAGYTCEEIAKKFGMREGLIKSIVSR